jgi:hypothetical protein
VPFTVNPEKCSHKTSKTPGSPLVLRVPSQTTTESPTQIKSPQHHRENPSSTPSAEAGTRIKERKIRNIKKKKIHRLLVVSLSATLLTKCSRSARITSRVFGATNGVSIP